MTLPPSSWQPVAPMRHFVQSCAAILFLLVPSLGFGQQHLLVAEDATSAVGYRSQVGRVLTFICPSKLNTIREIWGTDVYMPESPICTAAVHAGVFAPGASGQVTIVIGPGAASFEGTERHGVKSSSYGPRDSSYTFIKNGEPGQIDWYTTLDRVPDDFHATLSLLCPPKGVGDGYVWGTDVYYSNSAICLAAVHAGAITLEAGGRVTVTLQPKQETFTASERYGISSRAWSNWDYMSYGQPYRLSGGGHAHSGGGPRTIRLSGFIASGHAVPIVPRKIPLSGFTAAGISTPIVPRNIQLPGWTASGILPTP
jgi:hypothetical protein